jgi:hypothetical protein
MITVIISGTEDFPGKNNRLTGTQERDVVFGDLEPHRVVPASRTDDLVAGDSVS